MTGSGNEPICRGTRPAYDFWSTTYDDDPDGSIVPGRGFAIPASARSRMKRYSMQALAPATTSCTQPDTDYPDLRTSRATNVPASAPMNPPRVLKSTSWMEEARLIGSTH